MTQDSPNTIDDSSGNRLSNEARAYALLIDTLEKSNTTHTASDRWIFTVLSLIFAISALNMGWVWQINHKLNTLGNAHQIVNQQIQESGDGIFERMVREQLRKQNGNLSGTGSPTNTETSGVKYRQ